MFQITDMGVKQPFHFPLSPHLASLGRSPQWRGEKRERCSVMRMLLCGSCGTGGLSPHSLSALPRALLITRAISHPVLMLQYYSPSTELCFIPTDVYSSFGAAVFHVWRPFLWLESPVSLRYSFPILLLVYKSV